MYLIIDNLLSFIRLILSFDSFSCVFYDDNNCLYVCNNAQLITSKAEWKFQISLALQLNVRVSLARVAISVTFLIFSQYSLN